MGGAARQAARRAAVGLIGLVWGPTCALVSLGAAPAWALDCGARWLVPTDVVICTDSQLLRLEDQINRKIKGNATRLSFGQYLGLRHWQAAGERSRSATCRTDRDCILASLKAQSRFLDRLQRCVATNLGRRACLYNLLLDERASLRP